MTDEKNGRVNAGPTIACPLRFFALNHAHGARYQLLYHLNDNVHPLKNHR